MSEREFQEVREASVAPIVPADFLWTFDEVERKVKNFEEVALKLLQQTDTYHVELDVLTPSEKITIQRAENLLNVIGFCESGEEHIMKTAIHELKYLFGLVGDTPCSVCKEDYHPVQVMAYFECPRCKLKYVAPIYFNSLGEAEAWKNAVLSVEKEKGADALYCPFCIVDRVEVDGVTYLVYRKMEFKYKVEVNQYMVYPRAFILLDLKCNKCGYETHTGFPAEIEERNGRRTGHPVGLVDVDRYRELTEKCPQCGSRELTKRETFKYASEITESDRFEYGLPFPKRGQVIQVPPDSGVQQRYYFDLLKLEEPFVAVPLNLELTDRLELAELLDEYEIHLYDKEIRANVLERLRNFIKDLEQNIIRDRTHMFMHQDVAVVNISLCKQLNDVAGELVGLLDVVLRAYMREYVAEHGHAVLTPLREFKSALNVIRRHLNKAKPSDVYLEVPIHEFLDVVNTMLNNVRQLVGLAVGIKGWIMDKGGITKILLEQLREQQMALAEAGARAIAPTPTSLQDMIITALYESQRALSIEELAGMLGIPQEEIGRLRATLSRLERRGRVRRVGRGEYALSSTGL